MSRGTRRVLVGPAICLVATASIALLAVQHVGLRPPPVSFDLRPDKSFGKSVHQPLMQDSRAPEASLAAARQNLRFFSRSGDTRYLTYAKAILSASKQTGAAQFDHHLLTGRVLQAEHRFDAAILLLNGVLDSQPQNLEAQLLRFDALRRTGRIEEASGACLGLALSGQMTLARLCALQVRLIDAQRLSATLDSLDPDIKRLEPVQQAWALAVAAESATLAGDLTRAEGYFVRAMANEETAFATRLAHADALLALGRPADVADVLQHDDGNLAAAIRLTISQLRQNKTPDPAELQRIEVSLASLREGRIDPLLYRDKAVFELHVRGNPQLALQYALANFEQQKGSEDLALLHVAAMAAGDEEAMRLVGQWERRYGRKT